MHRRPRLTALVVSVGVALSVAVTACGGGTEEGEAQPVELGEVAPGTGAAIDVRGPIGAGDLAEADAWPSACTLLDEDVLRALLPQTEQVRRSAMPKSLEILVIGGESRTETVAEARCTARVGLPVEGLGIEDDTAYRFTAELVAVGEPGAVERTAGTEHGDVVDVDGHECRWTGDLQLRCVLGRIAFTLTADLRTHGQYVGSPESPFVLDGATEVVTEGSRATELFRERLLVPLGDSVIDRL